MIYDRLLKLGEGWREREREKKSSYELSISQANLPRSSPTFEYSLISPGLTNPRETKGIESIKNGIQKY